MGTGIALSAILLMVAWLVIVPLLREERVKREKFLDEIEWDADEESLEKSKEAVFTTINEIEFDYQMKKLSTDDYNQLKGQYKQKALELLHEEDQIELEVNTLPVVNRSESLSETGMGKDIEDEIERELVAVRRTRTEGR